MFPTKRKSPLGFDEYVVPSGIAGQYVDPGAMATTRGQTTYYRKPYADDPEVQTHERIHVGQSQEQEPPLADVIKAVRPYMDPEGLAEGSQYRRSEIPAYYFSTAVNPEKEVSSFPPAIRDDMRARYQKSADTQQQAFNNYVNLLYRLNPKSSQHVEAAMPRELMERYVRYAGRPAPPPAVPNPMEQESLYHALFGRPKGMADGGFLGDDSAHSDYNPTQTLTGLFTSQDPADQAALTGLDKLSQHAQAFSKRMLQRNPNLETFGLVSPKGLSPNMVKVLTTTADGRKLLHAAAGAQPMTPDMSRILARLQKMSVSPAGTMKFGPNAGDEPFGGLGMQRGGKVPDTNFYTGTARQGSYQTALAPLDELHFRQWVRDSRVPFEDSPTADYDMRGFWQALRQGDPRARTAVNPSDKHVHFPDDWKTPYHETFSNQSIYATPRAPSWINNNQTLVDRLGNVLYDERPVARKRGGRVGKRFSLRRNTLRALGA